MSLFSVIIRRVFAHPDPRKFHWFTRFDLLFLLAVLLMLIVAAFTQSLAPARSQTGRGERGSIAQTREAQLAPPCDNTTDNKCPPPDVSSAPGDLTGSITTATIKASDDDTVKNLSVTKTDDTISNKYVQTIWWGMVGLADFLLIFILIINGYRIMAGAVGFKYADAVETLPRIILAFIGVHISLMFIAFWIGLNNALCSYIYDAIANAKVPAVQSLGDITGNLVKVVLSALHLPDWLVNGGGNVAAGSENAMMGGIIIGIMEWFLSLFVFIQIVVRTALINLLTIISPLGMIAWALPQGAGQQMFRLWMNAMVAAVMVQFLQLTCYAGQSILFGNLQATLAGLLIPDIAKLAGLWLVLRVPGWLQNSVVGTMGNASQSAAAAINQAAMAVQQLIGTAILVAAK